MQPHENLWALSTAFVASRALHVVAELGVADHLADTPAKVEDLAAACGADPDALDRTLRLLATQGIFAADGDRFQHTETSRLLRSDHPMSMRAFARMWGLPGFVGTFDRLDHSLRTGAPAAELLGPGAIWGHLQRNPEEARVFGEAMTAKAAAEIAAVLAAYDFASTTTVADIGGGRGHLLRAVLDAAPAARGVLFDLPQVIDAFDAPPEGSDRLTLHAGDFFVDPLPAADLYLLMEVIHDWADAEAGAILRAVRRAAASGARVLLIENALADGAPDPRGRTLDLIMLAATGGRERSASRLAGLLAESGFHGAKVIETGGTLRLVLAEAT